MKALGVVAIFSICFAFALALGVALPTAIQEVQHVAR